MHVSLYSPALMHQISQHTSGPTGLDLIPRGAMCREMKNIVLVHAVCKCVCVVCVSV